MGRPVAGLEVKGRDWLPAGRRSHLSPLECLGRAGPGGAGLGPRQRQQQQQQEMQLIAKAITCRAAWCRLHSQRRRSNKKGALTVLEPTPTAMRWGFTVRYLQCAPGYGVMSTVYGCL